MCMLKYVYVELKYVYYTFVAFQLRKYYKKLKESGVRYIFFSRNAKLSDTGNSNDNPRGF